MRMPPRILVIAIIIVAFHTAGTIARDYPLDSNSGTSELPRSSAVPAPTIPIDQIPWPTLYGVHQTGSINAAVDCFGTIGMSPYQRTAPYPFWPSTSFESPPGSGHQYLWAGAIWIGGIVGQDTLVTCSFTGLNFRQEMYPTGFGAGSNRGTVFPVAYPTALSLRSEFDDTLHSGITYNPDYFGRPYHPLNVAMVSRSHSFAGFGADECVIYDVLVTNIGHQEIRQGYFGVHLDADVYSTSGDQFGYTDDLAGSIESRGIAYIVDNDGDPQGGVYNTERSPTKVMAFKFLQSSFQSQDTNFNWWLPNNSGRLGFGPRQKNYPRNFGTGGTGTPVGDGNEYYVMSTPEWDYDQVMTSAILPSDPVWQYPDPATNGSVHRGGDTRFLMSIGPFDLPPDSTVRVQFAVFTADSVHTDPFILDFVDIAPELYPLTLNLPSIERIAAIADSLGNLLVEPALPPTGLRPAALAGDSAIITWDPWVFASVDSLDISLSLIPDSAFLHPGVIPVWYRPVEFQVVNRVSKNARSCVLTGLSPGKAYACNIASRYGEQTGAPGTPVLFRLPDARYTVQLLDSLLLATDGSDAVVRWRTASSGWIKHFNIYRFADSVVARQKYQPFYSLRKLDSEPTDSVSIGGIVYYYYALEPYAQLSGNSSRFEDATWSDGNVYAVTAVDSSGTEFPFSPNVTVFNVPQRTEDICVLTNSGGRLNLVLGSTLKDFYTALLNGYRYRIFSYADSLASGCGTYMEECVDWRDFMAYRVLIIDDGMKDALFSSRFEDRTAGFRKYLATGGTIVYCGAFSSVGAYRFTASTEPAWFDLPYALVTENFGVDSIFYTGFTYYKNHSTAPYVDSLFGFVRAQSTLSGAPEIRFDASRNPFTVDLTSYWPAGTPPSVSTLRANKRGEVSHIFRSASPATSINEGQPIGVVTRLAKGQTFLFGFHLWYMELTGARQLVNWIMDHIATGQSEEPSASLPAAVRLSQNYPNPFNPSTTISFALDSRSKIRLEVFNLLGQQVRTLVDETLAAGEHSITFEGRNSAGHPLSSGVYLYRLITDHGTIARKMILLK